MTFPGRHLTAAILLGTLVLLVGCSPSPQPNRAFQTSTIPALLEGDYQGDMTLEQLASHGNFGLGTFNDVDGEMVLLDGVFYQVRGDGKVAHPPLTTRSPFATITPFSPTREAKFDWPMTYDQLRGAMDSLRPSQNVPYAIRLDGEFAVVQTRSVPRQTAPYRRLVEVAKEQPTFDFKKVKGTVIAFWFPQYSQGLNVPGYHLHFLTADHTAGGHVLDCQPTKVTVRIAELSDLTIRFPATGSFRAARLTETKPADLHAVEQAQKK